MSKVYILIEISKQERRRDLVNLRRYLRNHELNAFETKSAEKVISRILDPEPEYYEKLEVLKKDECDQEYEPIIKESTHQELLENWARQNFEENSDAMKLLFGSEEDNNNNNENVANTNEEIEGTVNRILKRASSFSIDEILKEANTEEDQKQQSVHTISSENSRERFYSSSDSETIVETDKYEKMFFDGEDQDDEGVDEMKSSSSTSSKVTCEICQKTVKVAVSKKAQLRAQLFHIVETHSMQTVHSWHLSRRYQCEICYKNVAAHVSPCEHISQYHNKDDAEIRFNDIWSKTQINECNRNLKWCFGRLLPVPRARRYTNLSGQKSNYTINSREDSETGQTTSTTTLESKHIQKPMPRLWNEEQNVYPFDLPIAAPTSSNDCNCGACIGVGENFLVSDDEEEDEVVEVRPNYPGYL